VDKNGSWRKLRKVKWLTEALFLFQSFRLA
jgi:hypothetical protein